jgi:hypothetical protein
VVGDGADLSGAAAIRPAGTAEAALSRGYPKEPQMRYLVSVIDDEGDPGSTDRQPASARSTTG